MKGVYKRHNRWVVQHKKQHWRFDNEEEAVAKKLEMLEVDPHITKAVLPPKACEYCGDEFVPRSPSEAKTRKFCSRECGGLANHVCRPISDPYPADSCAWCGGVGKYTVRSVRACSPACRSQIYEAQYEHRFDWPDLPLQSSWLRRPWQQHAA